HYINILLFALPLNILVYNQRNNNSTTPHTLKIRTTRLLCECELYAPANYDHDTQMKEVMDNFNKQTQQRFHEYDDRMVEKRKHCKDKCDKEMKKIILKDKLEKELMDKFATLGTNIQSDAIPTCVCEKSLADKLEKGCLRCAGVLGGGVMPGMGLIDGSLLGAISVLQPAALKAAKAAALTEAKDLATKAGMDVVVAQLKQLVDSFRMEKFFFDLGPIVNKSSYNSATALFQSANELANKSCAPQSNGSYHSFCNTIWNSGEEMFKPFAEAGAETYKTTFASKSVELESAKVGAVNTAYGGYQTAIIASIVAIVVIILIMVIIYLILRYRRKKKMKKKLQYIKLLEE
ncbi:rifin, partial [Plasmodium reichenowi]